MSKETLKTVRESWRKGRSNGIVLGAIFRFNLRRINPTLVPVEKYMTQDYFDFQLLQSVDEVVNCLDKKYELVVALKNLCCLFDISNYKRIEIEHISRAVLITIEQVMIGDFTLQLDSAKTLMRERLSTIESNIELPRSETQWINYIKNTKIHRE